MVAVVWLRIYLIWNPLPLPSVRLNRIKYCHPFAIYFPPFSYFAGENTQLDDLYTRYRQRLRKSLFESGLTTAFVACIICVCVLFDYEVKLRFWFVYRFATRSKVQTCTLFLSLSLFSIIFRYTYKRMHPIFVCCLLHFPFNKDDIDSGYIADTVHDYHNMRCVDSSSISDCNVITAYRPCVRYINNSVIGLRCG